MTSHARIAVIGTGWWATECHIPALLANPQAQLIALCDRDRERLQRAAAAYGVEHTYTEVDDLLARDDLDGVIITTNHASHYPIARACLEHDLHVLIEKPMTLYAADARHLVELAQQRGRQITLGYNHNHTAYSQRAREIVQSGRFGAVQLITGVFSQHNLPLLQGDGSWMRARVTHPGSVYSDPQRSGGGHGHLQITHLAGMIFFVSGLRPRRVSAMMSQQGLAVDLIDVMTVEFDNGALGTVAGTSNIPNGRKCDLQVYCERGWLDIDDQTGTLAARGLDHEPEFVEPAPGQPHIRAAASTDHFVALILGQVENGSSGEIGWRAVELLDAAYRSAAQQGAMVTIDSLYT
jgi:predicted dehydrogenase